jgi:hypothetical protein
MKRRKIKNLLLLLAAFRKKIKSIYRMIFSKKEKKSITKTTNAHANTQN